MEEGRGGGRGWMGEIRRWSRRTRGKSEKRRKMKNGYPSITMVPHDC